MPVVLEKREAVGGFASDCTRVGGGRLTQEHKDTKAALRGAGVESLGQRASGIRTTRILRIGSRQGREGRLNYRTPPLELHQCGQAH